MYQEETVIKAEQAVNVLATAKLLELNGIVRNCLLLIRETTTLETVAK